MSRTVVIRDGTKGPKGDPGEVQSVNGEIGDVVLDAGDVGADPAGTAAVLVNLHSADTTNVHGINDTSLLLTTLTKLDDMGTPDDNTDLNATTSRHGLLPKLSGVVTQFLNGNGVFSTPAGGGGGGGTGDMLAANNLSDVANAATARTNLGLGTAATTATTAYDAAGSAAAAQAAAIAASQPLDADLTALAALSTSSYGRALLTMADAAALRIAGGLGTMSTQAASAVAITGGTVTGITDLAIADGGTGASTAAAARTNLGVNQRDSENIRAYGGTGDGVADDTTAYNAAYAAAIAVGGTGRVFFPEGTWLLGNGHTTLQSDDIEFFGIKGRSIIKPLNSGVTSFFIATTLASANLHIHDLVLDGNGTVTQMINLSGDRATQPHIHDVEFVNLTTTAITLTGVYLPRIHNCRFWNRDGKPKGTAISCGSGTNLGGIHDNTFEWLLNGVSVDTGAEVSVSEDMASLGLHNNYFDGFWWLIASQATNSGGTVTYTSTVLTDTAAAFPTLTAFNNDVRALTSIQTGTHTTAGSSSRLVDTAASFITAGVQRGDIVRTSTAWACVLGIESATELRLDGGWRSLTAGSWAVDVAPPAISTAYTVYSVIRGNVVSRTATTLTVSSWHRLDGTVGTPANGTLYELLHARPNYHFHAELGFRGRIHDNIFRRGWSDQISIFGTRCQVQNNTVEDGQDFGITLDGLGVDQLHLVTGNRVSRQGSGGIFSNGNKSNITGNFLESASGRSNPASLDSLGGIVIVGNDNLVASNSINGTGVAGDRHAIAMARTASGNRFSNNNYTGTFAAETIKIYDKAGTSAVNTFENVPAGVTWGLHGSAVAQVIHATGTGTPEGVLVAAVGSTFRRTDGGTATTFYVKETGTSSAGWVAIGAGGGITDGYVPADTVTTLAELNTALTAASTAGSGIVLIPANTTITATSATGIVIPDNVTLRGADRYTSKILFTSGIANGSTLINMNSRTNARIENLRLAAPSGKTGLYAIRGTSAQSCTVDGLSIDANFSITILFGGQTTPAFNCVFNDIDFEGSNTSECMEIVDSDYCTISNNRISNAADNGIVIFQRTASTVLGNRITGNTITGCGAGISCYGDHGTVVADNVVKDCTKAGIRTGDSNLGTSYPSSYGTMTGNTVRGCNVNNGGYSNIVIYGVGWTVTGNTSSGTLGSGGAGAHGLELAGGHKCSIVGNTIETPNMNGIQVTGHFNSVVGNTILDVSANAVGGADGIKVSGDDNIIASNNVVDTRGTTRQRYGILLLSGSDRNSVIGNKGSGSTAGTWWLDSGADNLVVGNSPDSGTEPPQKIPGRVTVGSTRVGFYGTTPVVQSTGWAVTNAASDKVFDANATSIDELADVLGTLITRLISVGLISA